MTEQNIIIMSTNCYACGYRDNEVKSGGAIPEKGKCITLKVEDEEDLSRDLLKVCCRHPVSPLTKYSPRPVVSPFLKSILFSSPELSVVASPLLKVF